MTSTEPMTYKPGPELDRRIASLIGYVSLTTAINPDGTYGYTPAFSTSWEGMFVLVDSLAEQHGFFAEIQFWGASFRGMTKTVNCKLRNDTGGIVSWVHDVESAPLAVCLACLSALQHVSNTEEDKDA